MAETADKLTSVMDKIEEFYFGDGDESGEKMFKAFAEKHKEKFEVPEDAESMEHKVEYVSDHKVYRVL